MRYGWWMALGLLTVAAPAWAQADLRFCPNRPSLEESPCTVDPGHVLAEVSLLDWTRDDRPDAREDVILAGDAQLRLGLTSSSEIQLNWTAYGHDRLRGKPNGAVDQASGVGDVRLGFRQNLKNPDGSGLSYALEPYVTLPAGGRAIGAGDWAAGLVLPLSYAVTPKLSLQFTGQTSAAVNASRSGRHLSYGGDFGVGYQLGPRLGFVGEVEITADKDPSGHVTQATAAGSLAWAARKRLQLDFLVGAGLNRETPNFRFLTGGAVLF